MSFDDEFFGFVVILSYFRAPILTFLRITRGQKGVQKTSTKRGVKGSRGLRKYRRVVPFKQFKN